MPRLKLSSEKGQGVVEFALVFPVVFTLIMVILELGLAFYGYVTVVSAARQGARAGAVYLFQPNCDGDNDETNDRIVNNANRESGTGCLSPYTDNIRNTVASSMGVLQGFDKVNGVQVGYSRDPKIVQLLPSPWNTTPFDSHSYDILTVNVTYRYRFLTPVLTNRTLELKGSASARIEP